MDGLSNGDAIAAAQVAHATPEPTSATRNRDVSMSPTKGDRNPLIELKNGKVVFRQKTLSLEKMSETMQEIVKFREIIAGRMKENMPALDMVPQDQLPLIAKLVHESDKTSHVLAKHILSSIKPEDGADSNPFSLSSVEAAIQVVAERTNYGIEAPLQKMPASLCVWRWEVKDDYRESLPKASKDKLHVRAEERRQAKRDIQAIFDALPLPERESLLKGGKRPKDADAAHQQQVEPLTAQKRNLSEARQTPSDDLDKKPEKNPNPEELDSKKSSGRPKKDTDPEKAAKEKEKAEKKAAKAEKDKKAQEAQSKSRNMMSAFFAKAKPRPAVPPAASTSSTSQTDFEKTFKTFLVKKDVSLAPINWFASRNSPREIIVLDQDVEMQEAEPSSMSDLLAGPALSLPSRNASRALRTKPKHCVRDIMEKLTEAEITVDTSAVRRLTKLLASREKIPAKVLIFHEDTRPGYYGTFTRASETVGPRCPLKRDGVIVDYSYDSGEEWEPEQEGDDLMSVDGSGDENGGSEADSDLDSWLVDDDEVEVVEPAPSDLLDCAPAVPEQKRKRASQTNNAESKKRKMVVPLVPFVKGPLWEDRIGCPSYEPLQNYRIQLFNDTPFPIDPFTFVSGPVVERPSTKVAVPSTPSLPPAVLGGGDPTLSTLMTMQPRPKPAVTQAPKTTFPDYLLPLLVAKITELASSSITGVVEGAYLSLKEHKIKKNALEAKIREITEKCRIQRVWVVKQDVLAALKPVGSVPS